MNSKLLVAVFILLIFIPSARAVCDASYQTYTYKSAVFYVTNAKRIRVSVYNSMSDRYQRCFTAWIMVNGKHVNLDGLPYDPSNWQQAWGSSPNCFNSGYTVTAESYQYLEYDLGNYAPYTGNVEVRVSSDCYYVDGKYTCFCWSADVLVVEQTSLPQALPQYCYFDIYVKNQYGNPLNAYIYLDGGYLAYSSHVQKQVSAGTHVVSASLSGYSDASKTISCSCGETKFVELVLSSAQLCSPGEIRNRRCVCSTQVSYERCKNDGSGWDYIVEDCPPGTTCQNGQCVSFCSNPFGAEGDKRCDYNLRQCLVCVNGEWVCRDSGYYCSFCNHCGDNACNCGETSYTCPQDCGVACTEGYLNEYTCSGSWRLRKYQYSDCRTEWRNYENCDSYDVYTSCSWSCYDSTIRKCTRQFLDYYCSSGSCVYTTRDASYVEVCPSGYSCSGGTCVLEKDGWYDTGNERCNLYGLECGSGTKEKEQEYRDYTCFGATCTYSVTQRRWLSVGSCYQGCASGYTCEAGKCVLIQTCAPKYLDEYRCYDNWVQRKYLNSDCSTSWVFYEYCSYGCSNGQCLPYQPSCESKYLDEYRCYGNWVQRKYQYSDCSSEWINWQYCSDGYCSSGTCVYEEPFKMSVTVSTPANLRLGSTITTTVNVKNTGDKGGYVDLSAYVCKDFYCYSMICDGSRSLRIYVSSKSEYHLSCNAKAEEKGRYRIKVSYSTYGYSDTVYSGFFEILEKPSCEVGYINEFKCSGNWKLQLYKYADCSTAWVYVEYCSEGCYEGQCLPKPTTTTLPTTTTTTLPKPSVEEKALPITGWSTFVSVALPSLLLVFLIPLLILLILRKKKFGKEKPEWFNGDC